MLGRFQSIRRNCRVTNVTDDGPASLLHRRYSPNGNFALHYLSLMAGGAALIPRRHPCRQGRSGRAVISIWTSNSIRSDWVRAEAGRAKADGKLIPVKTPDVAYADIPLPFGEMHTENVASTDLIKAAVVAQLAKPAVEASAASLLAKGFKYEVLTWLGIVGGALTLFTHISSVLKLADFSVGAFGVKHFRRSSVDRSLRMSLAGATLLFGIGAVGPPRMESGGCGGPIWAAC
jgi:hypothetical protein